MFLTPPLTDSRPAVAELFAVIVSLCIGLSALVLLRANASRPTRHLTLALISFWAVTYGAYVAILPRFAHHVRDYQIVWWSRHETSLLWYPAVPAFLGSFPGMTLCLAAGLGYASRRGISQWPWRVLALGFFCGLVATGLARMPYHVRYHAALVPLAVVLSTFWWRQAPARMRVALVALGLTIGLLQGALITSTVSASALWPQTVWGLVDAFHHFHSEHHETRTDARNRVQMLARRLPDMLSLRTPASSGATQVAAAPLHVLVVVEPELCQGATEVMLWKPVWETWLAYGIDGGAPVAFVGNSRHPDDVSGFRVRTTPPGNAPSDTTSTGTSQAVLEALRLSTSFSSSPPIPGGASVPTAGGTPVDAVLLLAPADRIESATARVIGALDTHVATVATYAMPDHCAVRVLAPVVWAGP